MGSDISIALIQSYIAKGKWEKPHPIRASNSAKMIKGSLIDLPDKSIAAYENYICEISEKASKCFIETLTSYELSYAQKENEFKNLYKKVLGVEEIERVMIKNGLHRELSNVSVSLEYGPTTVKGKVDMLCIQGHSPVAVCLRVGVTPLGEKKFHQDACQAMLAFLCLAVRATSDPRLKGNKINKIFYCNPTCKEWYVMEFSEDELCRYHKMIAQCVDDYQKWKTVDGKNEEKSITRKKAIAYHSKDYYNGQTNFPDNFLI